MKQSKEMQEYHAKRAETVQHMLSFKDFHGEIFTVCDECIKKECPARLSGSSCLNGELKEELKQYL